MCAVFLHLQLAKAVGTEYVDSVIKVQESVAAALARAEKVGLVGGSGGTGPVLASCDPCKQWLHNSKSQCNAVSSCFALLS